jgi:sugar phosphate isomerase/epimerase
MTSEVVFARSQKEETPGMNRMSSLRQSRRLFCGLLFGAALVHSAGFAHSLKRFGLQLYTVRDLLSADFAGTLDKIARIGYSEVEFAGIYGPSPKATRRLLQALGPSAPSIHVTFSLLNAELNQSIDIACQLGSSSLVCPWLDQAQRTDWKKTSDILSRIGQRLKAQRLSFAYHNHDFEFAPGLNGTIPHDTLLENTDPDFVGFELDVYWATKGNISPLRYLMRYPKRFSSLHLKVWAVTEQLLI